MICIPIEYEVDDGLSYLPHPLYGQLKRERDRRRREGGGGGLTGNHLIEEFFIVIHPHFSSSSCIVMNYLKRKEINYAFIIIYSFIYPFQSILYSPSFPLIMDKKVTFAVPPGKVYGVCFLNTCPTLEQG